MGSGASGLNGSNQGIYLVGDVRNAARVIIYSVSVAKDWRDLLSDLLRTGIIFCHRPWIARDWFWISS